MLNKLFSSFLAFDLPFKETKIANYSTARSK